MASYLASRFAVYPFEENIPLYSEVGDKEARALRNCRSAIGMHEIFERVAVRRSKSYLPHGAIYKVTRDILKVGDVSLGLQHLSTRATECGDEARRSLQRLASAGALLVRDDDRPNAWDARGTRAAPTDQGLLHYLLDVTTEPPASDRVPSAGRRCLYNAR